MAIGPRLLRASQLVLITVFAFGLPILSSVQIVLSPSASGESDRPVSSAAVIVTLAFETLAIALLLFILFRRDGGIPQLGTLTLLPCGSNQGLEVKQSQEIEQLTARIIEFQDQQPNHATNPSIAENLARFLTLRPRVCCSCEAL